MKCSHCHTPFPEFKPINDVADAVVKEGTVNVCAMCGQVCVFDKNLDLVEMNGEQIMLLEEKHPLIYKIILESVDAIMQRVKMN